jgi:hypothetical protein
MILIAKIYEIPRGNSEITFVNASMSSSLILTLPENEAGLET